ncbi:MAG: heavy metal translocating P-type ATPase metal-binding domain-containing protein [Proteobacteria bacterium]|nr:heavy metal translocating P-type ATPase metal-binding domain-containing protein [Pseudomonadota bacterium]
MTNHCLHCGLDTVGDEEFCCAGCEAAYGIINKLGFNSFYQKLVLKKGEKVLKPDEDIAPIDLKEFTQIDENGLNNAYLMVEGLHCAACIWLIESVLGQQESVKKARINMSNKRLHLQWLGDEEEGNRLVQLVQSLGYHLIPFDIEILKSAEKKYDNKLLKAMAVAGFAAGNIMLLSVALWSSSQQTMGITTRNLLHFFAALIALPTIIYSGRIFFGSAYQALRAGRTNMDVPISIAIILVSLVSIYEIFHDAQHIYFDSAVMLIFFLLIGRYLDFSARRKALSISSDLMMLVGSSANIIDEDGQVKSIAAKKVVQGMTLLVATGEKIVADGVLTQQGGEIDTSLITGESLPKKLQAGDEVFAGTVNMGAPIKVQVNKSKEQTLLAQIVELVTNLEKIKSGYLLMADHIAKFYTPTVHILAGASFVFWYFLMQVGGKVALLNATAVLIITCPCALALAVPVVQIVAASRLMKRGIILKNSSALERLAEVNAVIFDKTGTLTIGAPTLLAKHSKFDEPALQLAASMAKRSRHPLSQALANAYKGALLDVQIEEIAGMGLVCEYQGHLIKLGRKEFVFGHESFEEKEDKGFFGSKIYLKYDHKIAIFAFQDTLREDANSVVATLQNMGKEVILLSGDNQNAVTKTAKQLNISRFYYDQTPIQKCDLLEEFKHKYGDIAMVGDGLNDAPSLAYADVSISPAQASDITKNAADIIFQGQKLDPILESLFTAQKATRLMKQNFSMALIYNLIAVPFAIAGFVIPLIAALAMSTSSIIVVLNSLRVR